MEHQNLRIRLRGYDHKLIDNAAADIVERAKRTGARIGGPIPLPTSIARYTVLRSPHVDKKSREQFEIRVHKRLIDIMNPTPKLIESLGTMNLPSGVEVDMKMM